MRTYTKTWIGTAAGLLAVGAVSSLLFDTGTALIMLALGLVTGAAIGIVAERGHVTAWAGWGALATVGAAGLAHADVTIFAGVALVFIGLGFRQVYFKAQAVCEDGSYCARPESALITKSILWLSTILVVLALTINWWAPLFY